MADISPSDGPKGNYGLETDMLAVNVKKADVGDLEGLLRIEERCFGSEKFSPETVRAFLERDDAFIVAAEEGGSLVGSAMCLVSFERREGRIASVAVIEDMRRKGVGSLLIRECERVFDFMGTEEYSLEVETVNEPAISMYLSHGYHVIGEIEDFYGIGRHAYFMVKKRHRKTVTVKPS